MKIILIILSVIIVIITIIMYLNIRKELKINKEITKEDVLNKTKIYNILLGILLSLSLITLIYNFINNANTIRENTNLDYYELYLQEYRNNFDMHTDLKSFPNEINKNNVLEFKEFNRDGLFDGSYFIYIVIDYDDDMFNNEVDRIKKLSIKEINDNNYKVYIISDDGYNTKEYVLINNNDKQIVYVFNQLFQKEDININKDYIL